jgi:hypothetical protein
VYASLFRTSSSVALTTEMFAQELQDAKSYQGADCQGGEELDGAIRSPHPDPPIRGEGDEGGA